MCHGTKPLISLSLSELLSNETSVKLSRSTLWRLRKPGNRSGVVYLAFGSISLVSVTGSAYHRSLVHYVSGTFGYPYRHCHWDFELSYTNQE